MTVFWNCYPFPIEFNDRHSKPGNAVILGFPGFGALPADSFRRAKIGDFISLEDIIRKYKSLKGVKFFE